MGKYLKNKKLYTYIFCLGFAWKGTLFAFSNQVAIYNLETGRTLLETIHSYGSENNPNLEVSRLWLSQVPVGQADIAAITKIFPNLEKLALSQVELENHALAHLGQLKKVSSFSILEAKGFSDEMMEQVCSLKTLSRFIYQHSEGLSKDGLSCLAKMPSLEGIFLIDVGDDDLKAVSSSRYLKSLMLKETEEGREGGFTDCGLKHLSKMTQLRTLTIDKAKITDVGASHLKTLKNLWTLALERVHGLSAEGFSFLASMPDLRHLQIDDSNFSDQSLHHLLNLNRLTLIELWGTKVTDKGVSTMMKIPALGTLSLKNSPDLTDESIEIFANEAKSLKFLVIEDTGITKEGADQLAKMRPDIQVFWYMN